MDDIPEKSAKTEQHSNLISILLFFVLIVVVVCTAGVAYLNSCGIDIKTVSIKQLVDEQFFYKGKHVAQINSFEFSFDTAMHPQFCAHKGFIVEATKDRIRYLDLNGEEQWLYPISMNNPIVKSTGDYLMAVDIKGKDIVVFGGKEKKWEKQLGNAIINAHISKNGYVTVIHEQEMSRTSVTVFNRQGMEMFTTVRAENYIISSKVSPSGKNIFVNSIDTSGINTNTLLEADSISDIMNSTSSDLSCKTARENALYPFMEYMDDNNLVAVGESEIILLGNKLEQKWQKEFDGELYSFSVTDKYAVVALSSGNSSLLSQERTDIFIIDSDGKNMSDYQINEAVKSIDALGNFIAINEGRHVYIINTDGELVVNYNSDTELNEVRFISGHELIGISRDSIVVLKIDKSRK